MQVLIPKIVNIDTLLILILVRKDMFYENILKQDELKNLQDLLLRQDFPWYFNPNIAFAVKMNEGIDPLSQASHGFTHTVWDIERGQVSDVLGTVAPIIDNFSVLTGIKPNNFLRIKINLQTPVPGNTPEKYNGAHTDRYLEHQTLIYYPFTSDGDLFIFNEIFDESDPKTHPPLLSPTVLSRYAPKENSLAYLKNGLTYHSSSNPINYSTRYSININFN